MKHGTTRLLALTILAITIAIPAVAQSPDPSWNVWQRQAYDNLISWRDGAIDYLNDRGYEFREGDADVGVYDIALVEEGSYVAFERMFYSGNLYFVLASGDNDIRDLDIFVYDSNGDLIAYDNEIDRDASVLLDDLPTGRYTIVVELYDGAASTSWVGWTVLWDRK